MPQIFQSSYWTVEFERKTSELSLQWDVSRNEGKNELNQLSSLKLYNKIVISSKRELDFCVENTCLVRRNMVFRGLLYTIINYISRNCTYYIFLGLVVCVQKIGIYSAQPDRWKRKKIRVAPVWLRNQFQCKKHMHGRRTGSPERFVSCS